jgi:Zn-dependent protease with chaperone function
VAGFDAADGLGAALVAAALAALITALGAGLALGLTLGPLRARRGAHWAERARAAAAARQAVGTATFMTATMFVVVATVRHAHGGAALAALVACVLAGMPAAYVVERECVPRPLTPRAWLRARAGLFLLLFPHLVILVVVALLVPRELGAGSAAGLAVAVIATLAAVLGAPRRLAIALGLAAPAGPRLAGLVAAEATRVGLPAPRALTLALPSANAYAWPIPRMVGVTERALETLDDAELGVVLAHELAHVAEPRAVAWARSVAPLALTPLVLLRPLLAGGRFFATGVLLLGIAVLLFAARALARRMELRADRAGKHAEAEPGAYARALARLYEANAVPAVLPGRARAHPHLYDRLVHAGVTPDWPRPAPPSLTASRVVAFFTVGLAVCIAFATGCAPAEAGGTGHAVAVACGTQHTCALDDAGTVRCWGDGARGQLGSGTFDSAPTPQRIPDLANVVDLAAGGDTTCAVTRSGDVWCWGANQHGQLGDGTLEAHAAPYRIEGLPPVRRVSLGYAHTCALDVAGAAHCWGFNGTGTILGDGPRSIASPTRIFPGIDIATLVAGAVSTCAVDTRGTATCAGDAAALPPGPVEGVRGLVLTAEWSCFARNEGLHCFGLQPGGTRERLPDAGAVLGALDVAKTSGGGFDHACVVTTNGAVHCLGKNDAGQLSGPMARGPLPVPVALPGAARGVAVGFAHSCAIEGGRAYCWGDDAAGQLGTGEGITSLDPMPVAP